MASESENNHGRAHAFGTFSAVEPLRSFALRSTLSLLSRVRAGSLARALGTTHFASFHVVPAERAASVRASDSEPAHERDHLLALVSFDGDREVYLHACSRVFGIVVDAIGSQCERWPGVSKLNQFLEYVRAHELPSATFFTAYPEATVHDVRAALRLTQALERFASELPAPDARQFRRRYERLLMELGADLAA
jgi:hypothetical protein